MRKHLFWRVRRLLVAAGLILVCVSRAASGAAGPLSTLPSEAGPHVEQLGRLAAGEWLELGAPAADPQWGRARGRSWCAAMPFAPELRGAFLFGEGVHGYAKPDGHYMDDLWFYDINAHRWICCYPGADTKTLELVINADGFEATPDGRPLPVSTATHAYSMQTYDTDRKRFMSMPNPDTYWRNELPQRDRWLKPPPADASPWFYETTTGLWDRSRTGTPAPASGHGDTFVYIPAQQRAFFTRGTGEVWFYDARANRWAPDKAEGPKPPFGIDATSCYDSKRERIYVGGGSYPVAPDSTHAFWMFDLKADRWVDLQPKGKPCQGSNSFPTKNALMVYDEANDQVVLLFHSAHDDSEDRLGVYYYDPQANAWSAERGTIPDRLGRNRQAKNGFYDPDLKVVFLHSAGDSDDNGVIWAYRPKSAR